VDAARQSSARLMAMVRTPSNSSLSAKSSPDQWGMPASLPSSSTTSLDPLLLKRPRPLPDTPTSPSPPSKSLVSPPLTSPIRSDTASPDPLGNYLSISDALRTAISTFHLSDEQSAFLAATVAKSWKQARAASEWEKWEEAVGKELKMIEDNDVWEVVDKAVGLKALQMLVGIRGEAG
jgi:hypothetical protein